MTTTFGIEEEFVVLDPATLATADLGDVAVRELAAGEEGTVTPEFFASQIEYASPVLGTLDDAAEALGRFRRRLGDWAADHGVLAVGSGTPFRIGAHAEVHAADRYARIAADIGALAPDHQINGLHVHVGIADRDTGVHASNALRAWLPVLLALSSNSPYWHGRDTAFASWRAVHSRRWTTYGIPPVFADAADYDRGIAALTGLGATSDAGTLNWNVRLSQRHPTVEVRVCDAQLDPGSAVALAAIVRALVVAGPVVAEPAPGYGDAALWHAARHGLSADLADPGTATIAPARHAVRSLHAAIAPALRAAGDLRRVERFLSDALRAGTGATRQWRAGRHGPPALGALYRESLTRDALAPTPH
ncbi:YbdK family carboxylate-amine ligase [Microbacterium sp. W1N]|uniref:carboxylate-amine ligase n=1 Tax=Microbacterium festucae TaxID=2977531 RepID=UPI0021C16192|nr:YbdK family carboxylate-amine ligase [Microbacterium festucae]MCT9821398.1 YbdK family carboxylate-amine ligase [Microbacterium festucae]